MPPSEESPSEPHRDAHKAPSRRVVFPWVWIGLIVVVRLVVGTLDITNDFKNLASLASVGLALIGLAGWYLLRGWGALPTRLLVAVLPFFLIGGCNALFVPEFNGAGGIVGLRSRSAIRTDEQIETLDAKSSIEGLSDWGPGDYDYPRFLGSGPWAEAIGPPINPNWQDEPPQELWRREVGAGWSAFAVYGAYAITQEQRGPEELVVCYRLLTGEPVWSHSDETRFDPEDFAGQMGRQGPRATPTIVNDRVYSQGATGKLNCLQATTGKVIWSIDTAAAYGADVAVWGKSGSPLHVPATADGESDLLVINVGAPKSVPADYNASLVAFDAETGEEVWRNGSRQTSYASPQLMTLFGERLILQTSDDLLAAYRAATGELAFEHPWYGQSENAPSCSQPIKVADNRFLLCKGYGHGASLLEVVSDEGTLEVRPVWNPAIKSVLQTKYSNTVLRDGYAYALNGEQLQCVEVETGEIAWRKRRRPKFGFGQVLLAGDFVLVMSEESGEVVLVEATPERYNEVGSHPVLTNGETCWNNPVISGEILLVRNAVEAAAFRLPVLSIEDSTNKDF